MEKSDNPERETRILQAAAQLFAHYGFDKTTVSDIAREAGVSKGAIYLHFASKEELLEALMMRETQHYAESWLRLLEDDPAGGTIGAMYKNSLYALNENTFMSAMFRQDSRVLGNYLRKPDNLFQRARAAQAESERLVFVRMMQAAGAVRTDIQPEVVAHIMDILAFGLAGMDGLLPDQPRPDVGELIEGIALMMDAALTPAGADPAAGKAVVRQIADRTRQQMGLASQAEKEKET